MSKEFFNAMRLNFKNTMNIESDESGGYLIPKDIQTKVRTFKENNVALENLVTVIPVSTQSGSIARRKKTARISFNKATEGSRIQDIPTPQFARVDYDIEKYTGILKVSNELLEDSDESLERVLIDWLGNDSIATRNKLIFDVLNSKDKTPLTSAADIKNIINENLKPVFKRNAIIVTNQDGYKWLDNLSDSNGRGFIEIDPVTSESKLFNKYTIKEFDNDDLPNDTSGNIPFIIGDLKESCILFDREQMTIRESTISGEDFFMDISAFKVRERECVRLWDEEAFIYGQVTL
ncbi:phage major capsid protein [Romboutsia ilealis]|uniref:phage major capsid protein n=1 Tax=Romboutsia ilealis TaxID=1115758 RepID=UPI00267619CB|nr:phage major capsid protein [Romboutsia ilealis]